MSWSVNMGGSTDSREAEAELVKLFKRIEEAGHVAWSTLTTTYHGSGDITNVHNNVDAEVQTDPAVSEAEVPSTEAPVSDTTVSDVPPTTEETTPNG